MTEVKYGFGARKHREGKTRICRAKKIQINACHNAFKLNGLDEIQINVCHNAFKLNSESG